MSTTIENISWIIIVPIFLILFAVIWKAAKRSSIFPEPACFIVALCVSILCIIGMFNFDASGHAKSQEITSERQVEAVSESPGQQGHQIILLPYIALGVSILAMLLINMLVRAWAILKRFFILLRQNVTGIFAPLKKRSDRRQSMRLDKTRKETIYTEERLGK